MLRILLLLLFAQLLVAQDLPSLFENYILENTDDIDENQLAIFYSLLENPINLNDCSFQELHQLQFLSHRQVKSIINYRKDKGKFQSIYELQAIKDLDVPTIQLLKPFVRVIDARSKTPISSKHRIRLYFHRFLEEEKEYFNDDYKGNPYKSYLAYSGQSKRTTWGFLSEKDAGEQWLDFNSLHFNIKGKNNQLFLGDYQLSLGQGLLCYQAFSFGKSAQVLGTFKNAPVLRSHSSTRENHFLRGLAYQQHSANWRYSFFISSNQQDANVMDSSDIVSSVSYVGLHRTDSELDNKRQLKHRLVGAHLAFDKHNFKTSVYSLFQSYDKRLILGQDTLSSLWGMGWDYSFTLKNTHFFGEYAIQQHSMAFLSGLNAQLATDLTFSSLYRNYSSNYYVHESNAFSEQSNVRNEKGLYS